MIARAMDEGDYVAVASLDMSAAFDVINVDLLIRRMEIIGLPKDLLDLLTSWLNDRWAYVEVEGNCSSYFRVRHGIVQGSCMGPVLFNLFIRPLLNNTSGPAYADDSYHIASGVSKDAVLSDLQVQIIRAKKST